MGPLAVIIRLRIAGKYVQGHKLMQKLSENAIKIGVLDLFEPISYSKKGTFPTFPEFPLLKTQG